MEIIILSKGARGRAPIRIGGGLARTALVFALGFALLLGYGGYRLGAHGSAAGAVQTVVAARPPVTATPPPESARAAREHETVSRALQSAEKNLDAFALRLGELQARVIRLDALGSRLVDMAQLDGREFDFNTKPPRGGPENLSATRTVEVPDFLEALEELAQRLEDRAPKLEVLEHALMHRKLRAEVHPAGRPVPQGWLSSHFGKRTDPISGKVTFHEGLDFAGRAGSDVVSVAAGVVIGSRYEASFGNLVEINHGGGYTTRYAHNQENLVKSGQTVKKGQRIALMGATGRSTGTHVHFELLKDRKPVNPIDFVRDVP